MFWTVSRVPDVSVKLLPSDALESCFDPLKYVIVEAVGVLRVKFENVGLLVV